MGFRNLALALAFSGSFFSKAFSQNVIEGCDYLRKLKVNTSNEFAREKSYSQFFSYNDFNEPFDDEAKNSIDGRTMNIYFQTKSSDLTKRDSIDLRRYVLNVIKPAYRYEKLNNFNVEGFADFRGSVTDNYVLSCRRVKSTARYLEMLAQNIVSPSIKIYVSAFGEVQNHENRNLDDLKKDRVVRIIPNKNPLVSALENCSANFYLLDQSGSMGKDGLWEVLQNFSFPDSSEVYSFSKIVFPKGIDKKVLDSLSYPEIFHSYDINTEIAYGQTPCYAAMDKFISVIPDNKVIDILVNGQNNFGEGTAEDVIKMTKEKNLIINMIGVNLSEEFERDLIKIVNETKGNYYFMKSFDKKLL